MTSHTGLQVIDDFLAGVLHEGEKADVTEEGLEDGGSHVGPIAVYEQFLRGYYSTSFFRPTFSFQMMSSTSTEVKTKYLPVEHAFKLGRVDHVSLEGGKEDLWGVTEDDDSEGNGEGEDVDAERHLGPAPFVEPANKLLKIVKFLNKKLHSNFEAQMR